MHATNVAAGKRPVRVMSQVLGGVDRGPREKRSRSSPSQGYQRDGALGDFDGFHVPVAVDHKCLESPILCPFWDTPPSKGRQSVRHIEQRGVDHAIRHCSNRTVMVASAEGRSKVGQNDVITTSLYRGVQRGEVLGHRDLHRAAAAEPEVEDLAVYPARDPIGEGVSRARRHPEAKPKFRHNFGTAQPE